MALQLTNYNFPQLDAPVPAAYAMIAEIGVQKNFNGSYTGKIALSVFENHAVRIASNGKPLQMNQNYSFTYNPDSSENTPTQAYDYLKTLPGIHRCDGCITSIRQAA